MRVSRTPSPTLATRSLSPILFHLALALPHNHFHSNTHISWPILTWLWYALICNQNSRTSGKDWLAIYVVLIGDAVANEFPPYVERMTGNDGDGGVRNEQHPTQPHKHTHHAHKCKRRLRRTRRRFDYLTKKIRISLDSFVFYSIL